MKYKRNENVIIVDANNICHIAYHSHDSLSYKDMSTGVVFGFFQLLLKYSVMFNTKRFIFCWDSKTNVREKIYPEYKQNRRQKYEQLTPREKKESSIKKDQFLALRKYILPSLGFKNNFVRVGYEADDLIAIVIGESAVIGKNEKLVVVSGDHDLYQFLNICPIYNPQSKKLITAADFKKEWGIDPYIWYRVKSIAGCSTDNIKGIAGVGEKTAIKILECTINENNKVVKAYRSKKGQEIVKRNEKLVKLPFKYFKIDLSNEYEFYRKDWIDMFDTYGFRSFIKEFKKWEVAFELQKG